MQNIDTILDFLKRFKDDKVCKQYLREKRWSKGVVCPFCKNSTSKIYEIRTRDMFTCSNCSKQFSVTVGTIFEKSQVPLQKWFLAIYLHSTFETGISSVNLSKQIGVTQKTAWFMLHRIRYAINNKSFDEPLVGTFEIDETFIGGKNKNRHVDKKVKNSQGRSFKDKTAVLGIYNNETQEVKSVVTISTGKDVIRPVLFRNIKSRSCITTDEWKAYNGLARIYQHVVVNHKRHQYNNDGLTTNHIENYWTRVKNNIRGTYHYVSRKHLQNYCNEWDFKHNVRLKSNSEKFEDVLLGTNNKRLLYSSLIR